MANSARIDELRKKFDENPRRYFAPLANEYRKSGDLDQAAFILEEYLPQQPGHMSGHVVYGQTLFELGRDEEAKRVFETALTLDPENLIALRHLGHIARQAGDFDAARSWYQRLLEADPRDSEIEQLLESLDSAAQAHAASPIASSDTDAPFPPPVLATDDSSPLQVEHVVEQEAPSVYRPTTHPLGPPPIATPALTTPVVEAASEPPAESEELLDLEDFSIGGESAHASPSASSESSESNESNESSQTPAPSMPVADEAEAESMASDDADLTFVGLDDLGFEATHDEPVPVSDASETEPLIESAEPQLPEHAGAAPAMDFVPFSDLPPETVEATENVSGLETYTFESAEIAEAEPAENLGSFFMEPTEAMPAAETSTPTPPVAAFTPVGSTPVAATTPVSATPVSATPVAASTPINATPAVSAPPIASVTPTAAVHSLEDSGHDDDTFATETMAKLYMNQGHFESALGIYRTLSAKNPADAELKRQIAEIEDRVQRRRREPTPPSSIETATPVEAEVEEPIVAATGPTIRDFLVGIIRRGVVAGPPSETGGGSIDELFGGGGAMDDDLVAADTLARAFAPEPIHEPMAGKPAREASTELSLDHVFREPGQTRAADDASGFSFDQFFAGDLADESSGERAPAQGDADDIEQFNAWLNGLKKT